MEQDKEKAKKIGRRLKEELERLKSIIPLDTDYAQHRSCGTAGCFGAKLAVMYHKDDPDYDFLNGGQVLAKGLEFNHWVVMLRYLYHWWHNGNACFAFDCDYVAYRGYSHDYKGVWQAWMDCAKNMIEGRQLR